MLAFWFLVGVALATIAGAPAHAEKRVALVIGNSNYVNVPRLPNPRNDAQDVSEKLKSLDFEVVTGFDVGVNSWNSTMREFERKAANSDVAVFYYAGHALQHRGTNYLMSVDAVLKDETDLNYDMKSLTDIRELLDRSNIRVKIIILDACCDNPLATQFSRTVMASSRGFGPTRGLARIDKPEGLIVVYATAAGQTADDGKSTRNSPFTTAFLNRLDEPGIEISDLFRRVMNDMRVKTNGRQQPEISVALADYFYLNRAETDTAAWQRARDADDPERIRDFMKRFPKSPHGRDAKTWLELFERRQREQLEAEKREVAAADFARRKDAEDAEKARQEDIRRAEQLKKAEEDRRRQAAEAEEARKREAAEAARKADEDRRNKAAQAAAAKKAEDDRRRQAAEAEEARKREAAEAAKRAEEARKLAEAEAAKKAEEDRRRQAAEAEEARKRQAAEAARKAEEDRRIKAAEAAAAKKADEDRRRQAAEAEEARKQQAAEAARKVEEEKRIKAAEAAAAKQADEARKLAEAAAAKKAEDDRRRQAADTAEARKRKVAEAAKKAEEDRRTRAAEAEAAKKAEEARKRAEAEASKKAAEDRLRLAAEAAAQKKAEEARVAAEAKAREQQASLAAAIRKAEDDARQLADRKAREDEQRRAVEAQKAEDDARRNVLQARRRDLQAVAVVALGRCQSTSTSSKGQTVAAKDMESKMAPVIRIQVQKLLADRGFFDGKADGTFNAATRSAISSFQQSISSPKTGYLTSCELEALSTSLE